jgi:hypothetical protein
MSLGVYGWGPLFGDEYTSLWMGEFFLNFPGFTDDYTCLWTVAMFMDTWVSSGGVNGSCIWRWFMDRRGFLGMCGVVHGSVRVSVDPWGYFWKWNLFRKIPIGYIRDLYKLVDLSG